MFILEVREGYLNSGSFEIIYFLKYETMSICLHVPAQDDLTSMLYLQDLYNVDMSSIYVVKDLVRRQETCVSSLNEAYTGHCRDNMGVCPNDHASSEGAHIDYPLDS